MVDAPVKVLRGRQLQQEQFLRQQIIVLRCVVGAGLAAMQRLVHFAQHVGERLDLARRHGKLGATHLVGKAFQCGDAFCVAPAIHLAAVEQDLDIHRAAELGIDHLGGLANRPAFRQPVERMVGKLQLAGLPQAEQGEHGTAGHHTARVTQGQRNTKIGEAIHAMMRARFYCLVTETPASAQQRHDAGQQRDGVQPRQHDTKGRRPAEARQRQDIRAGERQQAGGGGQAGQQHGQAGVTQGGRQGVGNIGLPVQLLEENRQQVNGITDADGNQE